MTSVFTWCCQPAKNVGKYKINKKVVKFYFLHRILEDFVDWIYKAFFEPIDDNEMKRSYIELLSWPTPFIINYKKEWDKFNDRIDKINKRVK